MKDGRVCGKKCYREKCHNHTIDRMTKDKLNHKNLRIQKAKSLTKDTPDTPDKIVSSPPLSSSQPVRENQDAGNISFGNSRTTQEKSIVVRDESHASHASHSSHPSHNKGMVQPSHASGSSAEVILNFKRWIEMVEKRIDALEEPCEKKMTMREEILGKIRKYVEDAECRRLSADELKIKVAPHYYAIRKKYGNLVRGE